jgi:hypothetical protein
MKIFTIVLVSLISELFTTGQVIEGIVSESGTNKPIEYAGVGVIGTPCGTITDMHGNFSFDCNGISDSSTIRISMIGYEGKTYRLYEFLDQYNLVELNKKPIKIQQVTIKPATIKTIGAVGFSRLQGWSGWGGLHVRKGYEIGLKMDLGKNPVLIKDLNILLERQAFDTSLYRLHIRRMDGAEIQNELLHENILITLTNESGWSKIDLEKYNLVLQGEIALTLEWLKVKGLNKEREMKINGHLQDAYILFKNKKGHIGIFRRGTEAWWQFNQKSGPSMYVTVFE